MSSIPAIPMVSFHPTEASKPDIHSSTPSYAGTATGVQGSPESHAPATVSFGDLTNVQIANLLRHFNDNKEPGRQDDYSLEYIETILARNPPSLFTDEHFAWVGLTPTSQGQLPASEQLVFSPADPQPSPADSSQVTGNLSQSAVAIELPGETNLQTAGVDTGTSAEMEAGIRLWDCEKILMATTPPIQDNAPPTSTSVSNQHREAEHRGLEPPSEPGSYPRRILIEDGDNMLEGDGGQDERPQQTFSPLSAKPAGEATPSPTAGCHTQSHRSASTTECIARNKTLLSKLRKIVLRGIQKETEDLIEKGETIQQKIQGFYLNCTVRPVGGAQPDDEDVFDVIIGILKKNQQPETKARTIVNLSDRLYAGLGWQLQHAVLTHHETEESIAGDDGCSDSGLGTSMIESQPSEDPRKFVKPASGAKPPQGMKRKRVHSNQSMRAPSLASSSQSLTTQRPEIATDKNCYFENCKRTEKITTSNQQHKHYLTHYPKKAALCPFIDRYGNICSRVFDSEHYKSNLPKHLRDEHNVDRSILESSKFRNEYLNPRLLISIPDRFHHTCLFCSETFTDAKSSRDHILRHEKTEPVEVLDQAYLEYGAKCTNHKLRGTEEYWKSSEPIQRAIRARRPLPWPPMILSGAETGGTASQPSDHFLAGTTLGYGHTMRDGSYGTPFTSSNGSSYYPQPSPSGYQTPYDELSRQNIQYLTTAINAPTTPPRMPMERWGRETIRDEPWNHLADATIQQEPPWDEIAPAYIANELAHSLEHMTIGVPRVGDEENCSTNDSDVSSTGDGLGMMWNPTC